MLAYRPTCRVIRVQTNRGPQETFFWGPQTLGMALVGHAGSVSGVCVCVCVDWHGFGKRPDETVVRGGACGPAA